MKLNIAVLAGDGIGPEIMEQALRVTKVVCQKFGHELITRTALVGAVAIDEVGNPYPDETHNLCMNSDAVLLVQSVTHVTTTIQLPKSVRNKACWPCVRSLGCMPTFVP